MPLMVPTFRRENYRAVSNASWYATGSPVTQKKVCFVAAVAFDFKDSEIHFNGPRAPELFRLISNGPMFERPGEESGD